MSNPNDGLIDTPNTGTQATQQLDQHQVDLAIQGFERLCAQQSRWPRFIPNGITTDISIDRLRSKRGIHSHLHSSLLPELKQQVRRITEALDNLENWLKEPHSQLQLVLEIQPHLHRTLDEMIHAIDDIIPGNLPAPNQTNDQYFQEFKCYRLVGLDSAIRGELSCAMLEFFQRARGTIKPPKKTDHYVFPVSSHNLDYLIDAAIRWLKGSELHIIPDLWVEATSRIDSAGEQYSNLFHPDREPPMSRPAIQLGRSILPIIKLSNLFFDKLETGGMKQKRVALFTEMSSHQLNFLHQSAEELGATCMYMVSRLEEADTDPPVDTCSELVCEIKTLSELFQSYVLLAELYIAPLFPDIDGLPSQIYYRSWFITWNSLFFTATHNAIQAANSFAENRL
ncbi:hypothetical protein PtA15_7A505 [Puccinia triticina]|uniref:Uncharacterized protein n=1 Tax=Puccinia triticina TaxID=208348 RepID=A0ABY7CNG0_9BASI|nr:uncharacterized protein PtA15_7A505 [Puccinia triticina]WAQ86776.1 hypothetical protein PtA15_7A505 [Puccinia triticina]